MSFSFKKLDVNIMVKQKDASEFVKAEENEINFNNASIITGDGVFDGVGIESNANMTGYVRVKVNYSGATTDAQKTAIALNSVLSTSVTYENSTNGYAWTYSNGYFYLVNASNKENVKEMNNDSNINYILFNDTFKMVDLTQFGNNLSTNGVSLQIKAEAVQSSNLQYTENGTTKNVTSVSDLEKTINLSNIFGQYTEAGHIVKYDTCGGESVDSYICLNSESKVATLPQVGGVDVTWYKDINFTQSVNSTAEESESGKSYAVTENITLYAKYSDNNSTIKVFFNANGGDENSTPSTQDVTKGNETTEIEIDKTSTKLGYKLSGWKVGKDGATTYNVNNGKISVKNTEITTKAITLYAVWEALSYTITFDVGGNTTYIDKLKEQFPTIKENGNNCILTYTINDAISLPKLEDATINGEKCAFVGWQVDSTTSPTEVWKIADILKANVETSGLYGNVVIKPLWGIEQIIKYEHSTIVKTYGDEDFINPITCISTEEVTFSYSVVGDCVSIDENGKVHIIKVGTATITATYGTNLFISYELTIKKKSINSVVVSNYDTIYSYTGNAIQPNIVVQDVNVGVLENGVDYSVTYGENKEIGSGTIKVVGIGNFTGERTITFAIEKAGSGAGTKNIANATITVQSKTYDATNGLPALILTYGDNNEPLKIGTDYNAFTSAISATTKAVIYIFGIGEYTGQTTTMFEIKQAELTILNVIALSRTANGTTSVELSGGDLSGIQGGDAVSFKLNTGIVESATTGAGKKVTTNIELVGEADVLKNYALKQPEYVTVKIYRPKVTFEVGLAEGNFASGAVTALYGEYGTKYLYDAEVGGTKTNVPTFVVRNSVIYKFNGYWDSASGGTQVIDLDYNVLSNFTSVADVTWYAQSRGNLKEFYDTTSAYYTGYVRGGLSSNYNSYINNLGSNKMAQSPIEYFEASATGDYVAFGYYPQTIKPNGVTLEETPISFANFSECYIGSDKYLYIAQSTSYGTTSVVFSNGESIEKDKNYYFRIEPILWQIVNATEVSSGATPLLMSVGILNYETKSDTIVSAVEDYCYKTTSLRIYLNDDFLSYFTDGQKALKSTKWTKGSIAESKSQTDDSGDYVFIPSGTDMNTYFASNALRIKTSYDYAGLFVLSTTDLMNYKLRSAVLKSSLVNEIEDEMMVDRAPAQNDKYYECITVNGVVSTCNWGYCYGYAPAILLKV